jgi:hypothetical protein
VQRDRGADDEDVRMCKRERQLTNELVVQHLLLHSSITGGDGGSRSGEVVRGAVGDGDGAGDRGERGGGDGIFSPCAFRSELEAFCCVCVERTAAKPNEPCDFGRDRNYSVLWIGRQICLAG